MILLLVLFFVVILALLFVFLTRAISYGLAVFGVIVLAIFVVWMMMEIGDEIKRRGGNEEEW